MGKRSEPPHRPLSFQKNSRIRWEAFEYYRSLKKVRQHLLDHITRPLSLGEAADIACLERTYFSRYFRECTGVNFKYWVDFERIQHAARLLLLPESSISQVATVCGYSGEMLTRTFQRVVGMTPFMYRIKERSRRRSHKSPKKSQ
jgi:AraC-like DNA-binding protein